MIHSLFCVNCVSQFPLSRLKAHHFIQLHKFFLNSIHGFSFSLVWKEKQYSRSRRGHEEGREEVLYSLTQLFCCGIMLHEDGHKNGCVGEDWWLSTYARLPFHHSPLLVGKLIESCSRIKLKISCIIIIIIKQCDWSDALQICRQKIEYRWVHVIFIHSSQDCCLYKHTD